MGQCLAVRPYARGGWNFAGQVTDLHPDEVVTKVRDLLRNLVVVPGTDDLSREAQYNATLLFCMCARSTLASKPMVREVPPVCMHACQWPLFSHLQGVKDRCCFCKLLPLSMVSLPCMFDAHTLHPTPCRPQIVKHRLSRKALEWLLGEVKSRFYMSLSAAGVYATRTLHDAGGASCRVWTRTGVDAFTLFSSPGCGRRDVWRPCGAVCRWARNHSGDDSEHIRHRSSY